MRCWFLCVRCRGFRLSRLFCQIVRCLSLRNRQGHLCFLFAFCLLLFWNFRFIRICQSVLDYYIIGGAATAYDNHALRRSSARSRWMDGRLGQNETRYHLIVFRMWWGQYWRVARLRDHGCRTALTLLNLLCLVHLQFFLYDFDGLWSVVELGLLLVEAWSRVRKLNPSTFGGQMWWRHSRIRCPGRLTTTIIP